MTRDTVFWAILVAGLVATFSLMRDCNESDNRMRVEADRAKREHELAMRRAELEALGRAPAGAASALAPAPSTEGGPR